MDIASIATMAAALLGPYLTKAGEEIAKKAGEGVWNAAQGIYQAITRKFTADNDQHAQHTLQQLQEQPTDEQRQAALSNVLVEKANNDPIFAKQLEQLVQAAKKDKGTYQFLTQVYGEGKVNKLVNIGYAEHVEF